MNSVGVVNGLGAIVTEASAIQPFLGGGVLHKD